MVSGEDVSQDYQLLVPEAKVAVPTDWHSYHSRQILPQRTQAYGQEYIEWILDPFGSEQG